MSCNTFRDIDTVHSVDLLHIASNLKKILISNNGRVLEKNCLMTLHGIKDIMKIFKNRGKHEV